MGLEQDNPTPGYRRYDSFEEFLKAEVEPEVRHMVLDLIARDNGTNNPQTDSRVDLVQIVSIEQSRHEP